jgi:hypothetical protein
LDFIPACHKSVSLPDTIPDTPSNTTLSPSIPFHQSIQQFQEELHSNTIYMDTLLQKLQDYYELVKTKHQLDFEVPAGFQKFTQHFNLHQQNLIHQPQQQPDGATDGGSDDCLHHLTSISPLPPALPESPLLDTADTSNTVTNTSPSEGSPPIVHSVDKPSSSIPCTITMSEDFLRASMGFRRVDTIKKHLTSLYCATIKLDSSPADAVLDAGDLAIMRKTLRNTSAVPRPSHLGDVVHMDIVFGPEVSIGNTHYGLIFSDRHSCMTYIYPLQNLTSDIPKQMQAFFAHLGMLPKRLISDFDLKLIGGSARNYLNSMLIHVNAAPSHHQDRNGLVERHWQTMVSMARNWLASSKLPSCFWFHAVKCAVEVCNYFPLRLEDGSFTTPFELAYAKKPDLRVLFKMFGLAAVRRERAGNSSLYKFEAQSTPMIAVGRCPQSNGLQFYNPSNGTFISSIDYKFQNNITSGTKFGYQYQPGTVIYRLDETTTIFTPKFALESTVLVHTHSPRMLLLLLVFRLMIALLIMLLNFRMEH